ERNTFIQDFDKRSRAGSGELMEQVRKWKPKAKKFVRKAKK
ncbi:unnamed protein product, partial [marine sediment metagenome]